MDLNKLSNEIIGAALDVHKALGPGLLETAYEECLCHELNLRGIKFKRQVSLPIQYKNVNLNCAYRIDILVEDEIVIELKAVEKLTAIHEAQLLTYLKIGGWKLGMIFNFNVAMLRNGIRRMVLGLNE